MKRTFNPWFFVILIILGVVIFNQFNARPPGGAISYSEFTQFVRDGDVQNVVIEQNVIRGELKAETQVGEGDNARAIREFQVTRVEDLFVGAPGSMKPIVQGASLTVRAGQGLGIVGPSASGKSTMARALVGVWRPLRGGVRLDGALLEHWNPAQLGSHVGYLPQDIELFDGTVAHNIARFAEGASSQAVVAAAKAAGLYMICTMSKHAAERKGCSDALFMDYRGYVAEATGANVFFVRDGEIHTPLADAFLNGITRQTVIQMCKDAGMTVHERHILPEEVDSFQECFLTGSAAEVTPVAQIGENWHFQVGPTTRKIAEGYEALVRS